MKFKGRMKAKRRIVEHNNGRFTVQKKYFLFWVTAEAEAYDGEIIKLTFDRLENAKIFIETQKKEPWKIKRIHTV